MHELYLKQFKLLQNSPYKEPPPGYRRPVMAVPQRLGHFAETEALVGEDGYDDHAAIFPTTEDDLQSTLNAILATDDATQLANIPFAKMGIQSLKSIIGTVYHEAQLSAGSEKFESERCLLDSGAQGASYVDVHWVQAHRAALSKAGALRKVRAETKLADGVTKSVVGETCTLTVCLVYKYKPYSADITFLVMPTLNNRIIIGLPHILVHFLYIHVSKMITYYKEHIQQPLNGIFENATTPWESAPLQVDAEEDIAHPCLFSEALHFMETTVDEALKEYRDLFDSHNSCRRPLAGVTPSGSNFGRNCPHGVTSDNLEAVMGPKDSWWTLFVRSRSINIENPLIFSSSFCTWGMTIAPVTMNLLIAT
jgi:hypothetical protein